MTVRSLEFAAMLGQPATRAGRRRVDRKLGSDEPVALRHQHAIRQLTPVVRAGYASAGVRFYDRRDNGARISLLGLGVALVGAVIALWWTTSVRVDLSVLRGPAAFLNYRDADRPTTRPGAAFAAPGTTVAPEVQAPAVAPPLINILTVPTAILPASADERMRVAHTDGLGVVLRNAARLDAREPRGLLEAALVTVLEWQEPDWVRVRSDGGQEGWVPAQYLLPT
jgi:hypothetical protein